jgi:UDP-glucuronate 4-epimerase
MKILITGTSGFIGFHLAERLLSRGDEVVGLDNINSYYDINLKYARLAESGIPREQVSPGNMVRSTRHENYRFIQLDLADGAGVGRLFAQEKFDAVCHLAAQAGVRYSLENPAAYIDSNIVGFLHILEPCRRHAIQHLVYASSSSVYGLNRALPFTVQQNVDHPISLYAATKKSCELMAHTYSHLFQIPATGLRFFTVYGPWGRPDMAMFLFTRNILEGRPIQVFNHGKMWRSFTYIDDIVDALVGVIDQPATPDPEWRAEHPDPGTSSAPHRVYNIGSSRSVQLTEFIDAIEAVTGRKVERELLPLQPGDVPETRADCSALHKAIGISPKVTVEQGVQKFVKWYRDYYQI